MSYQRMIVGGYFLLARPVYSDVEPDVRLCTMLYASYSLIYIYSYQNWYDNPF